ncbi:MAG: ABC transporter permease [Gemmatimonadales bacterium]
MIIPGVVLRLRALFRREATEARLDEEMRYHLELETDKNLRLGMSRESARRQARLDFGGVESMKEDQRDARGTRPLEDAVADVRYALRVLRRNPVLTGAAMLTLALGVGANTAIFSVVNAVILRPLPFPHSERLVMLSEDNAEKGWRRAVAAPANYLDWRERVKAFEDVAAYTGGGGATLSGAGDARQLRVRNVTGNYFSVLGVDAELGRTLRDAETWQRGPGTAVISHRLYQDALGGNPAALGRTIMLDGAPTEVVGVMPASFSFAADSVDVWQPMGWDADSRSQVFFRRAHWLRVVARLKPGVTPAAADAEFQTIVGQLQREFPLTNRVMGADLVPLQEFLIGDLRVPLLILQGAVGLLLLIACANVGNLLLAQAVGREREVSLRLALGARRERVVRQALTESLVLSLLGGAAGFALGWWGTRALAALQPTGMLPVKSVPMDLRVLACVTLITTLTGLLFGIAPAMWSASRVPAEVLKEGGKGGSVGSRSRRWTDLLVVGEIALALVLTVGAGLLVRSFYRLQRVDPGLEPHGVMAIGIRLPAGYDRTARQVQFFTALRERVSALPGVESAAEGLVAPFGGSSFTSDFHVAGRAPDDYGTEVMRDYVTPGYFSTLRVPLRAGRFFTDADREGAEPVVIINEGMALQHFRGGNPVGQRITFDKFPDSTSVWRTIVGVVGDVRQRGLALTPQVAAFEAFGQQSNSYMTLLVRARGDAGEVLPALRRVLAELDPSIAFAEATSLDALVARSIARQRYIMTLLLVFAATGLLLSVMGVYGVMAQMARRRSREMGIRIALGAGVAQVQWLVVRHGLRLVAGGLGLGLLGSFAATQSIRSLLYEVAPADPLTFVTVSILLALTALLASWLPAARASLTNPAATLRDE